MTFLDHIEALNKEQIQLMKLLITRGPITKAQIIDFTGMKLTTLNRFIKPLAQQQLITEVGVEASTGGRKPLLYDVNAPKYYFIGVDLSRTYTRIALVNLKMELVHVVQFHMSAEHTPHRTIELICYSIEKLLAKDELTHKDLAGIGLGTIGPLNRETGTILNTKKFVAPWSNVSLKNLLEDKYSCPIIIDNGANGAVLVEQLFGAGKGFSNLAYINCGLGFRTGVISDNHIVRSVQDSNNAFGHMTVRFDGLDCQCGKKGCLDAYCSLTSIGQAYLQKLKSHKRALPTLDSFDPINILLAADDKKDALAEATIKEAASVFGLGLANYINIMGLSTIILSGPLIYASQLFYEEATRIATENIIPGASRSPIFIKVGAYNLDSMAVGAACLCLSDLLS